MEKIKINNQIVQMRKFVKQAKVRIINKLVKEEKLLRNRKGNEKQASKAKRKAERLLAEIAILKKIKPDSISKLAISNALDWKTVLQQKNSTLEDRCIALLANYGPVQMEVKNFHSNNEHLVAKIPEYLKQWEEKKEKLGTASPKNVIKAANLKQKKKERKLKHKSSTNQSNVQTLDQSYKEQPLEIFHKKDVILPPDVKDAEDFDIDMESSFENADINKKNRYNNGSKEINQNSETIHSNVSSDSGSVEKDDSDDELSDLCLEDSHTEFKNNADKAVENTIEKQCVNNHFQKDMYLSNAKLSDSKNIENDINSEKLESNSFNERPDCLSIENNLKTNVKDLKKTFINKSNHLKTIKILNLDELKECDKIPLTDSSDAEDSADEQQSDNDSVKVKEAEDDDPFFIRDKSHNGIQNVAKHSEKSSNVSFIEKQTDFKHDKWKNVQSQQVFDKKNKFSQFSKASKKSDFKHENSKHYSERPLKDKYFSKNQPKAFSRLDKYNYRSENKQMHAGNRLQDKYEKNANLKNKQTKDKKNSNETGPLHPSWEAKRKMKANNVPFQGKRMIFND